MEYYDTFTYLKNVILLNILAFGSLLIMTFFCKSEKDILFMLVLPSILFATANAFYPVVSELKTYIRESLWIPFAYIPCFFIMIDHVENQKWNPKMLIMIACYIGCFFIWKLLSWNLGSSIKENNDAKKHRSYILEKE